jgi:hypothetical protein
MPPQPLVLTGGFLILPVASGGDGFQFCNKGVMERVSPTSSIADPVYLAGLS